MNALSGTWLAQRLGVDPVRIDRMRRAGELHAVRNGNGEWTYPSWQFDAHGAAKPAVRRLLVAARDAGLAAREVEELLERRIGLVHGTTVRELLVAGDGDRALAELRPSA